MEWMLTPVFLPEKSHGTGAWQATVHRVAKNQDTTEPQTHLKSCYCRTGPQGASMSSCPTSYILYNLIFIVVQPLNCVQFFATPWNAAHQASLSITKSQSLHKLKSIELVMLFNHLATFSSCPQSGSFPMSQLFSSDAKILELQYQSFQ